MGRASGHVRAIVLWIAPHGLVQAAGVFRDLSRGGAGIRRSLRIASSTKRRNLLHNARLELLPPRILDALGLVVDVGANVGDWTWAVVELGEPTRVIAVEPGPETAKALSDRYALDPRVQVVQAAIGASDGRVAFHVTRHSHAASIAAVAGPHSHLLGPGADIVEDVEVDLRTLDTLLAEHPRVTLLKIDVQGLERSVLAGARRTLAKTDWVLLEANFVHQYEGDALLPELVLSLEAAGFELANMSAPLVAKGQALFADALFRRASLNGV